MRGSPAMPGLGSLFVSVKSAYPASRLSFRFLFGFGELAGFFLFRFQPFKYIFIDILVYSIRYLQDEHDLPDPHIVEILFYRTPDIPGNEVDAEVPGTSYATRDTAAKAASSAAINNFFIQNSFIKINIYRQGTDSKEQGTGKK
jgi:hypothetical protein